MIVLGNLVVLRTSPCSTGMVCKIERGTYPAASTVTYGVLWDNQDGANTLQYHSKNELIKMSTDDPLYSAYAEKFFARLI